MKIVIADDEEIILKWMKKNVELLFPEHEIAAICINGKQEFPKQKDIKK